MTSATETEPMVVGVEIGQLSKQYPGKVALDAVDLHIRPGKMTVLLGPSGCGKTTLLRILAGLDAPTSGTIRIGDVDATGLSPARRNVGMVFQQYGLYPSKTVADNIGYPLQIAKVHRAERQQRVRDIAGRLGLADLLSRKPHQLSGGQKQRVGIGRALIRNPSLLLLDEPLSNLDAALRQSMRSEIKQLQQQTESTAVFVTHDQEEALAIADDIVLMKDGRIEQSGPAAAVYDEPRTLFAARFIGQANCIDTKLLHSPYAAVSEKLRTCLNAYGIRHIAFRPTARRPASSEGDLRLTGTVTQIELLGTTTLAHLTVEGVPLRVIMPRGIGHVGEQFTMHLGVDELHFFDSKEQRIHVAG